MSNKPKQTKTNDNNGKHSEHFISSTDNADPVPQSPARTDVMLIIGISVVYCTSR